MQPIAEEETTEGFFLRLMLVRKFEGHGTLATAKLEEKGASKGVIMTTDIARKVESRDTHDTAWL